MAFQPILDRRDGSLFAYEALVRGPNGEPAETVLGAVDAANRYSFDQACRVRAIELAASLGLAETGAHLSINFLPNAVYDPRACIRTTLETSALVGFPTDRLIFEITEQEEVADTDHLASIVHAYRRMGLRTAIDDFGAGHANLTLLSRFQPDIVKLDMGLIRGIEANRAGRRLVGAMVSVCQDLGILLIAEGIETEAERDTLSGLGISLMQGYLFARPGFERLPRAVGQLRAAAHAPG